MQIGVPKEIKTHEYRVAMVPAGVRELVELGHDVVVETRAGEGAGFADADYQTAGAAIANDAGAVFETAELVVKVKEPQAREWRMLGEGQILFTYLHLAADPEQAKGLMDAGAVAIAYETVTDDFGRLPLLTPMSEVAGRMSVQVGAHCLEKEQGGAGVLLGGVPGVAAGKVVIIGAGVAGTAAARMAVGLGAQTTILDATVDRLQALDLLFGNRLNTVQSNAETVEHYVVDADLVIGAVLVPGAAAPKIVSRELIGRMRPGSVVVDVSIDQGGCFETSRPTSHAEPTYVVDGVVHYCVTNMPGAVARTSTFALNNVTGPFVVSLAEKGYRRAMEEDAHLRAGLNVHKGHITHEAVAIALGHDYVPPDQAIAG
jgi:alanine dehydrogenase